MFPDPDKHIGALRLRHSMKVFGFRLSIFDMDVLARQVTQSLLVELTQTTVDRDASQASVHNI